MQVEDRLGKRSTLAVAPNLYSVHILIPVNQAKQLECQIENCQSKFKVYQQLFFQDSFRDVFKAKTKLNRVNGLNFKNENEMTFQGVLRAQSDTVQLGIVPNLYGHFYLHGLTSAVHIRAQSKADPGKELLSQSSISFDYSPPGTPDKYLNIGNSVTFHLKQLPVFRSLKFCLSPDPTFLISFPSNFLFRKF